ncbi:collagen alpha-1(I) chain-like [Cyrtonyx montezumae]|uniref:collagen alpha-1(I) chain-like n=1 Tax=Cyrtonyx montezumae TaxID=9017 RepID=UPI0032DAF6CD
MLFGVRASRVGSYVQQAQTAKRFAKDKVSRCFPHPSAGRRHTIHRTHGRSLRHPRHAGSPPPSPPSAAPSPAAPGEARQGEAAGGGGGAVTPQRGRGRGSVAERGVSAAPLRAEAPALGTGAPGRRGAAPPSGDPAAEPPFAPTGAPRAAATSRRAAGDTGTRGGSAAWRRAAPDLGQQPGRPSRAGGTRDAASGRTARCREPPSPAASGDGDGRFRKVSGTRHPTPELPRRQPAGSERPDGARGRRQKGECAPTPRPNGLTRDEGKGDPRGQGAVWGEPRTSAATREVCGSPRSAEGTRERRRRPPRAPLVPGPVSPAAERQAGRRHGAAEPGTYLALPPGRSCGPAPRARSPRGVLVFFLESPKAKRPFLQGSGCGRAPSLLGGSGAVPRRGAAPVLAVTLQLCPVPPVQPFPRLDRRGSICLRTRRTGDNKSGHPHAHDPQKVYSSFKRTGGKGGGGAHGRGETAAGAAPSASGPGRPPPYPPTTLPRGGGGFSTGERTAPGCGPAQRSARAPRPAPPRPPPRAAERGAGGRQRGSLAPTERERELQLAIDSEIYRQGDSPFCKNSLSPGSVHAPNALWRRAELPSPPPPPRFFALKKSRKGGKQRDPSMQKGKTRLTAAGCSMHRKDRYLPSGNSSGPAPSRPTTTLHPMLLPTPRLQPSPSRCLQLDGRVSRGEQTMPPCGSPPLPSPAAGPSAPRRGDPGGQPPITDTPVREECLGCGSDAPRGSTKPLLGERGAIAFCTKEVVSPYPGWGSSRRDGKRTELLGWVPVPRDRYSAGQRLSRAESGPGAGLFRTEDCGTAPGGGGGGIPPVPPVPFPRSAVGRAAGISAPLSTEQRRGSRPAERHRRVLHTEQLTGSCLRGSPLALLRRTARHIVPGTRLPPEGERGAAPGSGCSGAGIPQEHPGSAPRRRVLPRPSPPHSPATRGEHLRKRARAGTRGELEIAQYHYTDGSRDRAASGPGGAASLPHHPRHGHAWEGIPAPASLRSLDGAARPAAPAPPGPGPAASRRAPAATCRRPRGAPGRACGRAPPGGVVGGERRGKMRRGGPPVEERKPHQR